MARKRSKQRKAERARRQRKELDGLIGRHVVEQVLAGTESEGGAILHLTSDLGGRALYLLDLLKKQQSS